MNKLRAVKIAINLSDLMIIALTQMDEDIAGSLEEISEELENLGVLSGEVYAPFESSSLSQALTSDYILETNGGASDKEDYEYYNAVVAGEMPTVQEIEKRRDSLVALAKRLELQIKEDHTKNIEKMMKEDNTKWRKT